MAVSSLDYRQFTSESKAERVEFAHTLFSSFERTGFAKLHGHAFSEQEVKELFIATNSSTRPWKRRTKFRTNQDQGLCVDTLHGESRKLEKLHYDEKIRNMTDSKEHFDQGPEYDTEFPNKCPEDPELSGFRPFMEAFYCKCDEICLKLMEALEVAWGIEDGSLVARCIPSATDLRLTHYPVITVEEMQSGRTSRVAPHTDFGPITILFQDSTGGLETEDRSNPEPNSFAPMPPTEISEMIINVGDTLTRWTNGNITGGIHRVTTPEAMKHENGVTIPSRMSMAYLFKADRNVSVPKFVSRTEPARYPDITALEFQVWRNSIV